MNITEETSVKISTLVESQLPFFVSQTNGKFVSFLSSYYESLETKFQPLDIIDNLISYYNIGSYSENTLIEKTTLKQNLLSTLNSTVVTVDSTIGFPESNGYIKINDEIIFYRSKTNTQFLDCVRGSSSFILQKNNTSNVIFTTSAENPDYVSQVDINKYTGSHEAGSEVINIAYYFANEFFNRIRSEIAVDIPTNLSSELNIINFLKQIKSFYSAKGSLNAHKILFKILFNDKKIKIRTVNRGTGAKLRVFNYTNRVDSVFIEDGGKDYNSVSPPLIDVFGSGTGSVVNNILKKTAKINVTSIVDGEITEVEIEDNGQNYIGPITAIVRERSFTPDQIVRNSSGTGIGRVEYWDFNSNELVLYDVQGYFRINDTISGDGGELPVTTIAKAYPITDKNLEGNPSIQVIPLDAELDVPKNYILKPSSSTYKSKKIIRCKGIFNTNKFKNDNNIISLVQSKDTENGIAGVTLESSEYTLSVNEYYEFEIDINFDYKKLYVPVSSRAAITNANIAPNTTFTLTVEDAYGFPLKNGIIYVNGALITYTSRTSSQFFECKHTKTSNISINQSDIVYEYGRLKYTTQWQTNTQYSEGSIVYYGDNVYQALNSKISSSTPPTHTSGIKSDSTFGLKWKFIESNTLKHTLTGYFDSNLTEVLPIEFIPLALISSAQIKQNANLYSNNQVVDIRNDHKNLNSTALTKSFKLNQSNVVGNAALNSYQSTTNVHSLYEYEDHVYITSSSIPDYINSVNTRKEYCNNQKLLKRIFKYPTTQKSDIAYYTDRNVGITVDGVQILSPVANTIFYGVLEYIELQSLGDYKVPSTSTDFEYLKYPVFVVNGAQVLQNTSSKKILHIAAKFNSVNLTNLSSSYLTGFESKPTIRVVNNNIGGNPVNFRNAVLELSYNEKTKTIDNIIIVDSGYGYVNAPSIIIENGGKAAQTIPLKTTSGYVFDFRGELISYDNFNNENYKTIDVRNLLTQTYTFNPSIVVSAGSDAKLVAFSSIGKVNAIQILNSGNYYYTQPEIKLTSSSGAGAVLKAEINETTGKITSINIQAQGNSYESSPTITVVPSGSGGLAVAKLKSWTYNIAEALPLNNYGGYVYQESDSDNGTGTIKNPKILRSNLPESVDLNQYLLVKVTSTLESHYSINSSSHSPIIGWAYDGYPIYGRYGYSKPYDSSSSITAMTSKWTLKTSRSGGPSVSEYPLGTFIEDYQDTVTSSTLDKYNGRFCVTPEFPNGTYAYFSTTSYPYVIGPEFYGVCDMFNVCGYRTNDRVPQKFTRIDNITNLLYPNEINSLGKTKGKLKCSSGKIENILVEYGGNNYRVGDKLIVDNSGTNGTGFFGFVSEISGAEIESYQFVSRNGLPYIEFTTTTPHELSYGDFISIDYNRLDQIQYNLSSTTTVRYDADARLNSTSASSAKIYLDQAKTIPYFDSNVINIESTYIDVKTDKCPPIFYIQIQTTTYKIVVEKYSLFGSFSVEVDSDFVDKFYVSNSNNFNVSALTNLKYKTTSKSARGSILKCLIGNKGANYIKLPNIIGVESTYGTDAVLQVTSDSVGKIKNIEYVGVSEEFISNRTIQYNFNIPYTARVINNFEIESVTVVNGGKNYLPTPDDLSLESDYIKVNNIKDDSKFKFKIYTELGIISKVEVIDGGYNFTSRPTLEVYTNAGSEAILYANIKRKKIPAGTILNCGSNIIKVINYDSDNSVLQFTFVSGNENEIIENNSVLTTENNIVYGKLININNAKITAKNSPYLQLEAKFLNEQGFISESTQKILDSNYYQDWSYSLVSTRNTKEWKNSLIKTTHPAGFKIFGKNKIEKRNSFFANKTELFTTSAIFKTNLKNNINLDVSKAECIKQYITVSDSSLYEVGNYVYGNVSGAVGLIIAKLTDNYLQVLILNNLKFSYLDKLYVVDSEFLSNTLVDLYDYIVFYNGLFQNPQESYILYNDTFIPKFVTEANSSAIIHKSQTKFIELNNRIHPTNLQQLILTDSDNEPFNVTNSQNLLISFNGIIQNPSTYTVQNNIVTFTENLSSNFNIFVIFNDKLRTLTFTSTANPNQFTLNYTAPSNYNLIIVANEVYQNSIESNYTLSSNTITFTENIISKFGWYIDESVTGFYYDSDDLQLSRILYITDCELVSTTAFIESNSTKNIKQQYETSKQLLDGTVYADPSSTKVFGFDTLFTATTPEYSSSYVEVLNPIVFNGTTTTFTLKYLDGATYTPVNGESNILVNINNSVLDYDQYTITGSQITFNQAYSAATKCTIIDFNSKYLANNTSAKGANLDRLNVTYNGTRKTFNLSDRGVPKYVKNVGDIFVIKNGSLIKPITENQTLSANKITLQTAPVSSDNVKLAYFNRQLSPVNTKNVLLDPFKCFDGVNTTFKLTLDGILFSPLLYHLFVIRNGLHQKPGVDYTVSGSDITFTTAPEADETTFIYYSLDSVLTQNFVIDAFKQYDGIEDKFALTKDYISTTVESSSHLQVLRNGIYQYPTTDYTVAGSTNARYIDFTTAPTIADDIKIINYKSTDLVDVTSRFTQLTTTSLQYTSQTPTIDTTVFLIYINGILQTSDSWSFNNTTSVLEFGEFVSLSLDKVRILAFKTTKRVLDKITTTSGVFNYSLKVNNTTISTSLPTKDSDVVVIVNGVYQIPGDSYSISGSTITLLDTNIAVGSEIYAYQIGSSTFETEIVDYLNDDYSKSTYKLLQNYGSFVIPSSSDIFVIRNGIVQNPTQDYTSTNGSITFTTNIDETDEIFLMYRHASTELAVSGTSGSSITLSSTPSPSDYNNIIVYVNGVPQFNSINFTISGNTITLSENITIDSVFVIDYAAISYLDDINDCPNGVKTKFRLFYNSQNLIAADVATFADILVSINGVVQYPGVQYTLSTNRGFINFTTAPQFTDAIFMVRMHGNQLVTLSSVSGSTTVYNLGQTISTLEQENLVVFSNNTWKFNELNDYSYTTNSRITLTSANTSTHIFGIKFEGTFNLLDSINTPFNSQNNKFNMFLNQENFMPIGTIQNDSIPSETSILVVKNGKVLDPGVDYTLQGDIKTQIQFTSAPISTDTISIKSVGAMDKLDTITTTANSYDLKKSTLDYYPNKDISRPRDLENQILVIKNGDIQSPIYDYYIDNNKLVFNNTNSSVTKIVVLDFKGTINDVEYNNKISNIISGDIITIAGEENEREVVDILSPTVLTAKEIIKNGKFKTGNTYVVKEVDGTVTQNTIKVGDSFTATSSTKSGVKTAYSTQQTREGIVSSGFTGTATISNGKTTQISITNGGTNYSYPTILRTKGSGTGSKIITSVDSELGNKVTTPTIIQFAGYNQYATQTLIATNYSYVYRQIPVSTSNIRYATRLTSSLNTTAETISIGNGANFEQSTISITVSSSTGSGASFIPFVSKGRLRKITIVNGGSNYNEKDIKLVVSNGGGSGCVLEPILNSSGTITSINIRNSGDGYDTYRVIINSEVIEYTNIVSNQLIGCTRSSTPSSHLANDVVYFDKLI